MPVDRGKRRSTVLRLVTEEDAGPVEEPAAGPPRTAAPPAPETPAEQEAAARSICLRALQTRARTGAELARLLEGKGIPADVAEAVLERFADVALIDDAAFATAWVTNRHAGKGLARGALRHELRSWGVHDETVDAAIAGLDPEVELATARALVARRMPATRGLDAQARVRRLAGLLARKGYPSATAYQVVREALAAEGQDVTVDVDELSTLED